MVAAMKYLGETEKAGFESISTRPTELGGREEGIKSFSERREALFLGR